MVPEDAAGRGDAVLFELARDAEVGQLGAPLLVDQDVLRLDVAVDHVAAVGDAEAARDLDRVGDRLLRVERADPPDPLLQRLSLDVLEDDVGVAAVLAGVDHRDDVGVGQLGDRPGLLAEALQLVLLLGHLAVHHLDRDRPVERVVTCQVDGRHAAAAQFRLQPVAAGEHGSDHRAGGAGAHLGAAIVEHAADGRSLPGRQQLIGAEPCIRDESLGEATAADGDELGARGSGHSARLAASSPRSAAEKRPRSRHLIEPTNPI